MTAQNMLTSISELINRVTSETEGYHSEAVWSLHETKPADETATPKQILIHMISLILAVDVENKDRDIPDVLRLDDELIDALTKWISSIKVYEPTPEPVAEPVAEPDEEEETDDEEEIFECETCQCELDPNDLINSYHNNSSGLEDIYQCADCWDADQEEDHADESDEEDDIFCGGCGFTPCVEPEDPMDMRLCERCYKDSIAE